MHCALKRLVPALMVCAIGCTSGASDNTDRDIGGSIIVVLQAEPSTLFPPAVDGTVDRAIVSTMFDRLAEIGPGLNTVGDAGFSPRLAASWGWAKDSLSIAFHLDPRARWHDGQPVRAKDVRFTWQVYADSSSGSMAVSLLGNIDSCSVADSLTAVFWFKRRTPQQFYDVTYNMFVLPSHLLDTVPMHSLKSHPLVQAPVGTGRFRFVRWDRQARIEIIADTANFRGRAKLDRVVWSVAGDGGAAAVKLFAGEGDVLEAFPIDNIPQLAKAPQLRLAPLPKFSYAYLGLNLRDRTNTARPHPVLGDVRVRRALSMAIDRVRLTRTVFDSLALPAIGPAPRVLFPWDSALHAPTFDVAHARALLDSAGWIDPGKSGVRMKNGVPLTLEIFVASSNAARVRYATLMLEQFQAIGTKVSLQQMPGLAVRDRVVKHDFDAFMTGLDMNPGLLGMPQAWSSKGIDGLNYDMYANPKFDALLDSAITGFNPQRTSGLWVRAFQQILDDAPAIWLYEERNPVVMHKRIRSVLMRPDDLYAGLADWSIDPAQRIARDRLGLRGSR